MPQRFYNISQRRIAQGALYLALLLTPFTQAQGTQGNIFSELEDEILKVEIQMLEIEHIPSKKSTLELLRKKHTILSEKLRDLQAQAILRRHTENDNSPYVRDMNKVLAQPYRPQYTMQKSQETKPREIAATHEIQPQETNTHEPQNKRRRAKNRSGFLLGFSLGWAKTEMKKRRESTLPQLNRVFDPITPQGMPFGIRIGYQSFLDGMDWSNISPKFEAMKYKNPIGFRLYADSYAFSDDDISASFVQGFGACNFDVLLEANIPHTRTYVGGFAGVGYGMATYSTLLDMGVGLGVFWNLGLALTLGAEHRIELYYKFLPTTTMQSVITSSGTISGHNYSYTTTEYVDWKSPTGYIGVAYQYTF